MRTHHVQKTIIGQSSISLKIVQVEANINKTGLRPVSRLQYKTGLPATILQKVVGRFSGGFGKCEC